MPRGCAAASVSKRVRVTFADCAATRQQFEHSTRSDSRIRIAPRRTPDIRGSILSDAERGVRLEEARGEPPVRAGEFEAALEGVVEEQRVEAVYLLQQSGLRRVDVARAHER